MGTFFQDQIAAKRQTKFLLIYFALAVVGVVLGVYTLIWLIFLWARDGELMPFWNLDLMFPVGVVVAALISISSIIKLFTLRAGGSEVATMLGGTLVPSNTQDFATRRLLNVVEEMSIASGVKVPPVYLLPNSSINAFAAGHSLDDAVLGFTEGAITHLSRDELQGVVAHEFSHIFHGDMRLNLRLIGLLHGILILSIIGEFLLRSTRWQSHRSRRSDAKNSGQLVLLGMGLMAVGSIGVFFGRIIQSAISRQREFLADASAVQYTRYPPGLAGALKKIGGLHEGSLLRQPRAQEVSHMFFAQGVSGLISSLFHTHPPLRDRIRRLEPSFDGKFPVIEEDVDPFSNSYGDNHSQVAGLASGSESPQPLPKSVVQLVERIAQPTAEHVQRAQAFLGSLESSLTQSIHDPLRSRSVLFALFICENQAGTEELLSKIEERLGTEIGQQTRHNLPILRPISRGSYLSLIDLCIPALRQLSDRDYDLFERTLRELSLMDQQISFFEYLLHRVLLIHVRDFDLRGEIPTSKYDHSELRKALARVLSYLTLQSKDQSKTQQELFALGQKKLQSMAIIQFEPQATLDDFDLGLNVLDGLPLNAKQQVIEACFEMIVSDRKATLEEFEILRLICDSLRCPVPPFDLRVGDSKSR